MTSLNTTTGRDANKQTGSNLTYSYTQESRAGGSGRDGSSSHKPPIHVTPSTSSSSSTSASTLAPGAVEVTKNPDLDKTLERQLFFKTKYDHMTGVRIASTLGGFFLIVLLTLLYKSKCKHKHSREPSPLTVSSMPYPLIHPQHLMRGQNIQVNGRHDFGDSDQGRGGGGPGGTDPGQSIPSTLLDSSYYGYMNQVHPANSHQPVFSNCYHGEIPVRSPAVLLTSANSESSEEDLSLISEPEKRGSYGGPEVPPERKQTRNPLGPLPPCRKAKSNGYRDEGHYHNHHLHPKSKSPPFGSKTKGENGNIDINVILPTPSISPSGSENFNIISGHYHGEGHHHGAMTLLTRANRGNSGNGSGRGDRRLLVSRSLSSDNENDNSEMSGVGASDSEAAMLAFGCGNSSVFSLDNLKYVDDTSSENIPTRASDADDQDPDNDTRSIGSDSVFACFEHNFDHVAPTYARRVSSVSGTSSSVLMTPGRVAPPPPDQSPLPQPSKLITLTGTGGCCGFEDGNEPEFQVTLTQAHAQVHHRDSFCSDLESVNDYMETGARRRSSSTQTTFSDLRRALGCSPTGWNVPGEGALVGDTLSGNASLASYSQHEPPPKLLVPRRRRSLSPHNITTSVASGANLLPPSLPSCVSSNSNSTSAFLSMSLLPPPLAAGGSVGAVTPTTPTNPPMTMLAAASTLSPTSSLISPSRIMRKRSFEGVRKPLSLQYEENVEAAGSYVSSSNETTPTN